MNKFCKRCNLERPFNEENGKLVCEFCGKSEEESVRWLEKKRKEELCKQIKKISFWVFGGLFLILVIVFAIAYPERMRGALFAGAIKVTILFAIFSFLSWMLKKIFK